MSPEDKITDQEIENARHLRSLAPRLLLCVLRAEFVLTSLHTYREVLTSKQYAILVSLRDVIEQANVKRLTHL